METYTETQLTWSTMQSSSCLGSSVIVLPFTLLIVTFWQAALLAAARLLFRGTWLREGLAMAACLFRSVALLLLSLLPLKVQGKPGVSVA